MPKRSTGSKISKTNTVQLNEPHDIFIVNGEVSHPDPLIDGALLEMESATQSLLGIWNYETDKRCLWMHAQLG
jgi:hypothetical protein